MIGHSLFDIGSSRAQRVVAAMCGAGRPHPLPLSRKRARGDAAPQVSRLKSQVSRPRSPLSRHAHLPAGEGSCATAPAFEVHALRRERSAQPTTSQPFASDGSRGNLCNASRCVSCCLLQMGTGLSGQRRQAHIACRRMSQTLRQFSVLRTPSHRNAPRRTSRLKSEVSSLTPGSARTDRRGSASGSRARTPGRSSPVRRDRPGRASPRCQSRRGIRRAARR